MVNLRMTGKVPVIVLLNKFTEFHVILLLLGLLFSQSITASNAALPATSPVFLEARDDSFSAGLRSVLQCCCWHMTTLTFPTRFILSMSSQTHPGKGLSVSQLIFALSEELKCAAYSPSYVKDH